MRILTLDAALARCGAAVVDEHGVLAERFRDGPRGAAAGLAALAGAALQAAGGTVDLVAVTVGPGSFTGLRAALALAHGYAAAAECQLVAVSVGEALRAALADDSGRAVWVAIDSRRGTVFLDRNGDIASWALEALPAPAGPLAVAGDAAIAVAARLAARGTDTLLTDARLPAPMAIAAAARQRVAGALPPLAPQPLYIDPPQTHAPASAPRPPP